MEAATERFCALVTGAPDLDTAVPGSAWTVRQVAAHLVTVAPRYAQGARHEGEWVSDPRDLSELNDRQLRQLSGLGGLDAAALTGRLRADIAALLAQVSSYRPASRATGSTAVRWSPLTSRWASCSANYSCTAGT